MRIGVSVLTREGHNIWNSGIDQNVYHLACLLESLPFIEKVVLLDCGAYGRAPAFVGDFETRFEIIPLAQASDCVDVAIEVAGGLDIEWSARFRARGGKVVTHICGQPYAGLVDTTTFGRSGNFGTADRCEEIWILPKEAPFANMLGALHRCPVFEVPFLWAPVFMDAIITLVEQEGKHFGYRPGSLLPGQVEPAIFEPNISPIKMGTIPFMACEQVQRVQPDLIKQVHFMNSEQFASHPTFISLVGHSDLYKAGRALLRNRDYFAKIMGGGGNMVVSHQLMCPQNYVYLDALYGNYPLIHNSPLFSEVGYYYPDSDVEAASAQIQLAVKEHDRGLSSYKARGAAKIASLSPYRPENQDVYAKRLLALVHKPKKRKAL